MPGRRAIDVFQLAAIFVTSEYQSGRKIKEYRLCTDTWEIPFQEFAFLGIAGVARFVDPGRGVSDVTYWNCTMIPAGARQASACRTIRVRCSAVIAVSPSEEIAHQSCLHHARPAD